MPNQVQSIFIIGGLFFIVFILTLITRGINPFGWCCCCCKKKETKYYTIL